MSTILEKGACVRLDHLPGKFSVLGLCGRGSSSVAYRVQYIDETGNAVEYLMKEFAPQYISLERKADGSLYSPQKEAFQRGLDRFERSYRTQEAIRQFQEFKNVTAPANGLYTGNGTKYILTQLFNGKTYDQIEDKTLEETLVTLRTLTYAIQNYHNAGYLHLDIKPSNFLILPETRELVILFDFDSVVKQEELKNGASVSYSPNWAAPEQEIPGMRDKICQATDIFSIGEILFFRLIGRHSKRQEQRSFAEYPELKNAPLLSGIDERIFAELADFFRHTLCCDVKRRWQNTNQVLAALDKLLTIARKENYLCSSCPAPNAFFIARDRELAELHEELTQKHMLILSGMGGIGKSELAKVYAQQHKNDYDTVQFVIYSGSWLMTMTDDIAIKIANFERFDGEKTKDYFDRKLRKLRELYTRRDLLIVDNVDGNDFFEEENDRWRKIQSLNCTLLLTSRFSNWGKGVLQVNAFDDVKESFRLFYHWCDIPKLNMEDRAAVKDIILSVQGHTMAVEMIAKQLSAGDSTPCEMRERLREHGLRSGGREKVSAHKDDLVQRASSFDIISALFNTSALDETKQIILMDMALVHPNGMQRRTFREFSGLDSLDKVNELCDSGWLTRQEDRVCMHPLVSDVVLETSAVEKKACDVFLKGYRQIVDEMRKTADYETRMSWKDSIQWTADQLIHHHISTKLQAYFLNSAAMFLGRMGEYVLDEKYAREYMIAVLRLYGEKNFQMANAYSNYASVLYDMENYEEAKKYYQLLLQLLDDLREKPSFSKLATTYYNNAAELYCSLRDYETAEKLFLEGLKFCSEKEHDKGISITYRNLARLYMKQSRYHEADEQLQLAYTYVSELGDNYFNGALEETKGCLCFENGDYEGAIEHWKYALTIIEPLLGATDKCTASLYHHLGDVMRLKEQYEDALNFYSKALTIENGRIPIRIKNVDEIKMKIASVHFNRKDFQSALKIYEEMLIRTKKLFGENSRRMAALLGSMAAPLREAGDYQNAFEYLQRTLRIYQENSDGQENIAAIYSSLGENERLRGHINDALHFFEKSLKIRLDLFGNDHASVALLHGRMGNTYYDAGDFEKAVEYYALAMDYYMTHPEVKPSLRKETGEQWIDSLRKLGRDQEADRIQQKLDDLS